MHPWERRLVPVWYGYQAVDDNNNCDYDEIVVKSEQQVLPIIGIVYFRRKVEKGKLIYIIMMEKYEK